MAGITISAITGNESAMKKAQQAKQETDAANELEEIKLAVVSAMVNGTDGKVSAENLRTALTGIINNTSGITGNGPWTITGKSGTRYKIYSNGQVEKLTSQTTSNLEPGIYDENDEKVMDLNVDDNGELTSVLIPLGNAINNGTMTEEEALGELSRIKKVVIPDEVTSIGEMAFGYCTSLSSIEIPSSVTSIGNGAFGGCTSLSSIEIPSSVTSIGDEAFSGCTSLSSIEIPSGVTSIGVDAFYCCTSLSSIEIPSSVTSIGNFAFQNCTSLSSIEIQSGVTSIGNYAFADCTSLTSIEIPSGVTSISYAAFNGCTNLSSIEIPSSVTSIGENVFEDCTSLSSITIHKNKGNFSYEDYYAWGLPPDNCYITINWADQSDTYNGVHVTTQPEI